MLELLVRSRKFIIGAAVVLAIVLFGVIGPMFTPNPLKYNSGQECNPPSPEHPLGTANFGEDALAQLCSGTRNSLMVGTIAGCLGTLIAILVGGIGPYKGGLADEISNALTNIVIVFPTYCLLIIIAGLIEQKSLITVAVIIGLTTWPWAARSIRSQVLTLKEREFINVARMSGMKGRKIMITEILPNMLAYIVMVFVIMLSIGILAEAGLSMIGLGPDNTANVTLGSMLYWVMNPTNVTLAWDMWWCFFPPGIILTTFLGAIFVAHAGMDEVFNPRLRKV